MNARRWASALSIASTLVVSGCSLPPLDRVGMGVGDYATTWTVGSCHRLDQLVETDPMFASDTSPAVSCAGAHESETYADVPITGAVAESAHRPSPLWLESALSGACSWQKMAGYLGDQAPDITQDISVLQIIPSVPEWDAGVREVRCDALIGPRTTASVASISQSLRGIVGGPAAVRFRVCRLAYDRVPCNGLHNAELVYPYVPFTDAQLARDHAFKLDRVLTACAAEVAAYVGAPLSRRPDLVLQPELPGDYPDTDSRAGRCWVAPVSGFPVTGSVRRTGDAIGTAGTA